MTLDHVLAVAALAALAGFLTTIAAFVPDIDLMIVIAVCLACAGYDFWRTFALRRAR